MHHRAKFNQNRSRFQRYGDLTVFMVAAVCHLGFLKFNFLTVWVVNRPILHYLTKMKKPIHATDIGVWRDLIP